MSNEAAATTTIRLTGRVVELARWGKPEEIQLGDGVTEELYWEWLEALPPAANSTDLMQMGEPMDHGAPDGRPRYLTLQKHGETWVYTGIRARRERVTLVTFGSRTP